MGFKDKKREARLRKVAKERGVGAVQLSRGIRRRRRQGRGFGISTGGRFPLGL